MDGEGVLMGRKAGPTAPCKFKPGRKHPQAGQEIEVRTIQIGPGPSKLGLNRTTPPLSMDTYIPLYTHHSAKKSLPPRTRQKMHTSQEEGSQLVKIKWNFAPRLHVILHHQPVLHQAHPPPSPHRPLASLPAGPATLPGVPPRALRLPRP